ncbi:MAG: PHP domain-containing protein [Oligosphaeraceae bacterium]
MIDLHCHSTASDGTLTPTQLVALARKIGLNALALTDHDTLDGLEEFRRAGKESGLCCVPGVELAAQSATQAHWGFHIVGLFLQETPSREMATLLQGCLQARAVRNATILERLHALEIPLTMEEVEDAAGGEVVGRPHFALALQRRGVVPSVQAAFERFLATGKPAYASRKLPTPEEAISAIHSMGGVAVWAHPFTKGNHTVRQIHQMAVNLKAMGMDGMEAHYAMHTPKQVENVLEITREVGLFPSGGSDFHGEAFRNVHLGTGTGNLQVPDRYLEPLRLCARRRAALAQCLQRLDTGS